MYCLKIVLVPNLPQEDVTAALSGKEILHVVIVENVLWILYK